MRKYVMDFERPLAELEERLEELKKLPSASQPDIAEEIIYLEGQVDKLKDKLYSDLSPWQRVQVARYPNRPRSLDYIDALLTDFLPLRGDRLFRDDPAIVGGLSYLDGQKLMVIGEQKGKDTKENLAYNFGMPHPEGYRKALRLMKLAGKFGLPLLCLIDTPGAYPGIEAEERGQALAIANNLMEMSRLPVPIVVVNIGEGGSGGALALGVGDRIFMLENAYYSVISPEGCASILWRDEAKAAEAAETLKLTAESLLELGIIDGIVKEPLGGAHHDPDSVTGELKKTLTRAFANLSSSSGKKLTETRYQRLRRIGVFEEEQKGKARRW